MMEISSLAQIEKSMTDIFRYAVTWNSTCVGAILDFKMDANRDLPISLFLVLPRQNSFSPAYIDIVVTNDLNFINMITRVGWT